MYVIEAKRMNYFVLNCVNLETSFTDSSVHQFNELLATLPADLRRTMIGVACYRNEVRLIRVIYKSHARHILENFESLINLHCVIES